MSYTFKNSACNVFITPKMRDYVVGKYKNISQFDVIEVGGDAGISCEFKSVKEGDIINVIYCGNYGHMHDLSLFFKALELLNTQVISMYNFEFYITGNKYAEIKNKVEMLSKSKRISIKLSSSLNKTNWVDKMNLSHISLVSLKPGGEKLLFPSKYYNALSFSHMVMSFAESDSDLAIYSEKFKNGYNFHMHDTSLLVDTLNKIPFNLELLNEQRQNSRQAALQYFDTQIICNKYVEMIKNNVTLPN